MGTSDSYRIIYRFFIPTVQLRATKGARTLIQLGTHRNQYRDLEPNHMYIMQRRVFGLQRCKYVKDVDIVESQSAFNVYCFDYEMIIVVSFRVV